MKPIRAALVLLAAVGCASTPPWMDAEPPETTREAIEQNVLAPERAGRLQALAEDHASTAARVVDEAERTSAKLLAVFIESERPNEQIRREISAFRDRQAAAIDALLATHVGMKALSTPGEWTGIVRRVQPTTDLLLSDDPPEPEEPMLHAIEAGSRASAVGDAAMAEATLAAAEHRLEQVVRDPRLLASATRELEKMRAAARLYETRRSQRLEEARALVLRHGARRPAFRAPLEALASAGARFDAALVNGRERLRALLSAEQWEAICAPDPASLAASSRYSESGSSHALR